MGSGRLIAIEAHDDDPERPVSARRLLSFDGVTESITAIAENVTAAIDKVKPQRATVQFGVDVGIESTGSRRDPGQGQRIGDTDRHARVGARERPAAMTVTDQELRTCTVRIDVDGAPSGSGFFVAPNHVVTCAHVVEGIDADGPACSALLAVSDVAGRNYRVEKIADAWDDPDVAVLRVSGEPDHDCALLIGGVNSYDELLTFAYPERRPEGVARQFTAEGATGDGRHHALSRGHVQPGMSGAPVLNRRTGGVCGVLRLTRDARQDLGGYAIPIEEVASRMPTLARQNLAYHQASREWLELLSPEQRRVLLRPSETAQYGGLFVVSLGREGYEWEATATVHRSGAAVEALAPEEVNLNVVRDKVARLFRDWAARGRAEPHRVAPGRYDPGEEVRLLGEILFSAVLPGEIGKRLQTLIGEAEDRVQFALHIEPRGDSPEVVEMPWEHLLLPSPKEPAARAEKLVFVRALKPDVIDRKPPPRRALSVLLIGVPQADDPAELAVEQVEDKCLQAADGVRFKRLHMPTADQVSAAVEGGEYDIVHYVGFGHYTSGADRLALCGRGAFEYVNAEQFDRLLSHGRPRAVVLQEIEGTADAHDFVPADLSVVARELLLRGAEAAVGYQFPVPYHESIRFNAALYSALAAGKPFERAVHEARSKLWARWPESHGYLSPAVIVAQPGDLRLTAPPAESAALPRVGVMASNA